MNIGGSPFVVRRILVAVDASTGSINLLESAAALAAGLNAEISAIFVEDINLLRLAGLPFAREVAWSSAAELNLDYHRMERVLRGRATHAQQAVISATARLKLRGSLQITRGQIVVELLRAAADTDLLLLGKSGAQPGKRLGGVALRLALEAPCSVLLKERTPSRHPGTLVVDFAGHERDDRLLSAAAQIARAMHARLMVVIPASREADFLRMREAAQGLLGKESTSVAYLRVKHTGMRLYQDLLRGEEGGMVALDAGGENSVGLEHKVATLDCEILLVR